VHKTINKQLTYFLIVTPERIDITFNNIATSRLFDIVFTEIKSVWSSKPYVFINFGYLIKCSWQSQWQVKQIDWAIRFTFKHRIICMTRWMNTRTYWSSYQTRKSARFIFLQKVFYCYVFKTHRYWKRKLCLSKKVEMISIYTLSGFKVIAFDDGNFLHSKVKKLSFIYIIYN